MAALDEEQTLIRDQAKAWASEQAPVQEFRAMRDSGVEAGFDAAIWTEIVGLGWPGMIVPEQYGGAGLSYLTFGLVLEEIGRQLTASPLVASALVGAGAIIEVGSDEQRQTVLPHIADGSAIVTLAIDEGPRHDPVGTALSAELGPVGFTLNGAKTFVLEGMSATSFVVAARTSGQPGETQGISMFLVPADAPGLSRTRLVAVDSRGYANLAFEGVEVPQSALMGSLDEGYAALEIILDKARAGIAAEMLGTASQAFDMALEYLKTRVQFGQVIGSFQALGHRAADLFTEMELARSCMEGALQAIDAEADDAAQMVSLSKCRTGEFLHHMSNQLIQIHGGIGMTDEFDAGFYLKRARVLENLLGNQAFHRDRFSRLVGF
ncbi:MAG: acyl-CoA dehydrogenase [Gammaproteobacteria bacterium]|nr:acyl-CoA dehydrogenase [Gammaproteobacteria bacterium]